MNLLHLYKKSSPSSFYDEEGGFSELWPYLGHPGILFWQCSETTIVHATLLFLFLQHAKRPLGGVLLSLELMLPQIYTFQVPVLREG